jgi:hypothetical protein
MPEIVKALEKEVCVSGIFEFFSLKESNDFYFLVGHQLGSGTIKNVEDHVSSKFNGKTQLISRLRMITKFLE